MLNQLAYESPELIVPEKMLHIANGATCGDLVTVVDPIDDGDEDFNDDEFGF